MNALVDTPVWSEFLRRSAPRPEVRTALRSLVEEGTALLLGPIRQEILSGLRDRHQFERLKEVLRAFPDEPIHPPDYEEAASMLNACRSKGIQGSNTDFLICAVSHRLAVPVFTLDQDFDRFAQVLPVKLFKS